MLDLRTSYYDSVHVYEGISDDQKKQREAVYWGLGDNWWKQIIDRDCHKYGPEVFDKGLHKREVEPGFLQGIRKASEIAAKFLGRETSVAVYKEIHWVACVHFVNSSLGRIQVDDLGRFWKWTTLHSYFDLLHHDWDLGYGLTLVRPHRYANEYAQVGFKNEERRFPGITEASTNKELIEKMKPWVKLRLEEWEKQVSVLTSEIDALAKELGFEDPLVLIEWEDNEKDCIILRYPRLSKEKSEKAVIYLFDRFNQKARDIQNELKSNLENANPEELPAIRTQYETDIRQTIAKLYQHLEWVHPFVDGQGRTDLILLAKLLTDYGLHPALLMRPYDSSILPFAKWDEQLAFGLKIWNLEKTKINT